MEVTSESAYTINLINLLIDRLVVAYAFDLEKIIKFRSLNFVEIKVGDTRRITHSAKGRDRRTNWNSTQRL